EDLQYMSQLFSAHEKGCAQAARTLRNWVD
ncbi:unnamed protein product, partial [marine sediment metagenome]